MSIAIDPPPDWYIRQVALRALRGETVTPPPDEPSNVHSIALARTNRAIRLMRGQGSTEPAA